MLSVSEDACGLPSNQPRFLFIKITGGEEAGPTRGLGRPVCKLQISTTVEEQSLPKNGLSQLPTAFIPGKCNGMSPSLGMSITAWCVPAACCFHRAD